MRLTSSIEVRAASPTATGGPTGGPLVPPPGPASSQPVTMWEVSEVSQKSGVLGGRARICLNIDLEVVRGRIRSVVRVAPADAGKLETLLDNVQHRHLG